MVLEQSSERRSVILPLAASVIFGAAGGLVAGMIAGVYLLPPLIPADDALARRLVVETRPASVSPETAANTVAPSIVRLVHRAALRELRSGERSFGLLIPESAVIGRAAAVTSDGWLVTDAELSDELRDADAVTEDGALVHLDDAVPDPGSGALFLRVSAENLSAVTFGESQQIRAGDDLLAVAGRGSVSVEKVASRRAESGDLAEAVTSSETIPTRLVLGAASASSGRGSPVIDRTGRLVGILTGATGRVIPAANFRAILSGLFRTGAVHRPFLGARAVDLSLLAGAPPSERIGSLLYDLPGKPAVARRSPAAAAGLRTGDVILAIEGKALEPRETLAEALRDFDPGDRIELLVRRGADTLKVAVTLGDTAEVR